MCDVALLVCATTLAVLSAVLLALLVVLQRRCTRERADNHRWRHLARERADRISMLSHEVRTPLALIVGSAELLSDGTAGPLTSRQRRLTTTIDANSRHLLTLTGDLLAEARIDSGEFVLRPEQVDIRALVRDAVEDLRGLHDNDIVLDVPGAPPRVTGDAQLLRQAVINLITNAVRHGGPAATVTVRARERESGVMLSVTDNGTGMSEKQRAVLFRRTLEGKSPTGNGLGMIITDKIVRMHGGRLVVDTISAHGTRMIMSLPRNPHEH